MQPQPPLRLRAPLAGLARQGDAIFVAFCDSGQPAEAVNSLLDHLYRKQPLGRLSYAYAMDVTWPKTRERRPALLRLVLSRSVTAPRWPAS